MKNLKVFIRFCAIAIMVISCSDDDSVKDQIYEFISFQGDELSINENTTDDTPVVLKLLGYEPKQDITVNLTVINNNVQEGVDYTISTKTATIKKGEFTSEPIYISTIDNNVGVDAERSFTIGFESSSNPDLKFGVGLDNPENAELKVIIVDDECTDTVDIFNGALSNVTSYGTHSIVGSVGDSEVTIVGDLISYGPFSNAELKINLEPESSGATKGTATFPDYEAGTDSDGYEYQFRQIGEGTYDVCSRTIVIDFEVYWLSGGNWTYWYTSNNIITVQ